MLTRLLVIADGQMVFSIFRIIMHKNKRTILTTNNMHSYFGKEGRVDDPVAGIKWKMDS
jgi:hypothetical protein